VKDAFPLSAADGINKINEKPRKIKNKKPHRLLSRPKPVLMSKRAQYINTAYVFEKKISKRFYLIQGNYSPKATDQSLS
jgi:hypothetical protein